MTLPSICISLMLVVVLGVCVGLGGSVCGVAARSEYVAMQMLGRDTLVRIDEGSYLVTRVFGLSGTYSANSNAGCATLHTGLKRYSIAGKYYAVQDPNPRPLLLTFDPHNNKTYNFTALPGFAMSVNRWEAIDPTAAFAVASASGTSAWQLLRIDLANFAISVISQYGMVSFSPGMLAFGLESGRWVAYTKMGPFGSSSSSSSLSSFAFDAIDARSLLDASADPSQVFSMDILSGTLHKRNLPQGIHLHNLWWNAASSSLVGLLGNSSGSGSGFRLAHVTLTTDAFQFTPYGDTLPWKGYGESSYSHTARVVTLKLCRYSCTDYDLIQLDLASGKQIGREWSTGMEKFNNIHFQVI